MMRWLTKLFAKLVEYMIIALTVGAVALLIIENTTVGAHHRHLFTQANLALYTLFSMDVLIRLLISPDRKAHFGRFGYELLVLLPWLTCIYDATHAPWAVSLRMLVLTALLVSRAKKDYHLMILFTLQPARTMVVSFMFTIMIGTVLLMLPAATQAGIHMPFVDALFTATSATCVTGLAVVDVGTYLSRFGQIVLATLIQVGGLGVMTFSASMAYLLRRKGNMRGDSMLQSALDTNTISELKTLVTFIIAMTFAIEGGGMLALAFKWHGVAPGCGTIPGALYQAGFHSVSAFCNAGFSTFPDNLMSFTSDGFTLTVIMLLIIFGGLGFIVIMDLLKYGRHLLNPRNTRRPQLRLQTRMVLPMTLILIFAGAALLYLFERNTSLAPLAMKDRIFAALFQSVTARTAGFNSVNIGLLTPVSTMILIVLMFIGASPGSTGGGVKTTTVVTLWAAISAHLRRREHVQLFNRTLPTETVLKAGYVVILSLVVTTITVLMVTLTNKQDPLNIIFESVSAFGTVGLSRGITPLLDDSGKLWLTLLMFIGRVGVLSLAYSLANTRKPAQYEYAQERVMIG